MSKQRGRKRTICHESVILYAQQHPDMFQAAIALHFHTTQSRISHILREAGVDRCVYRGRAPEQQPGQTDEEYYWELILHNAGLGMDRGRRLHNQHILYGYDPAQEIRSDESATQQPNDNPTS